MVTALYASILAMLMCWLAFQVIKARRKHKIRYGDGGIEALQIARTAHSNSVDYIPTTLILMALLEFNGASAWLIHLAGIIFTAGRIIHCRGILTESFKGRVSGMRVTFFTIFALSGLNILFLPFSKLFPV